MAPLRQVLVRQSAFTVRVGGSDLPECAGDTGNRVRQEIRYGRTGFPRILGTALGNQVLMSKSRKSGTPVPKVLGNQVRIPIFLGNFVRIPNFRGNRVWIGYPHQIS